jgi:hypothetical protein
MTDGKKKYYGAIHSEHDAAIEYDKYSILEHGLSVCTPILTCLGEDKL